MYDNEFHYPVYSMSTSGLDKIAESTRMETHEASINHKYQCEK